MTTKYNSLKYNWLKIRRTDHEFANNNCSGYKKYILKILPVEDLAKNQYFWEEFLWQILY